MAERENCAHSPSTKATAKIPSISSPRWMRMRRGDGIDSRFHLSIPNLLRTVVGGNAGGSLVAVCLSNQLFEDDRTTLDDLALDRFAPLFHKEMSVGGNRTIRAKGFYWDDEDAKTTRWRPQGVTTYRSPNTRFVLVSWYGRKDEGYADRGGRISVVDNMQYFPAPGYHYGHFLLVDENVLHTPRDTRIEQVNGTLYVADSRKGQQSILEFDLANGVYEVPEERRNSLFGYQYVLRQSSSFPSPTKPSFMSYDVDRRKFLVGTYARCGRKVGTHVDSEECFNQPKNRLAWFGKDGIGSNASNASATDSLWAFSEMQGAASSRVGNDTFLWIVSSYGPVAGSHLHVVKATAYSGDCPGIDGAALDKVTTFQFAPGLEDLHVERDVFFDYDQFLWMLTEFGERMVFMTLLDRLLPRDRILTTIAATY
ncbi:LOW QUALITY PROTEIN: hypothetical protein ACHAXT_006446 [Thalassiosira profunda]